MAIVAQNHRRHHQRNNVGSLKNINRERKAILAITDGRKKDAQMALKNYRLLGSETKVQMGDGFLIRTSTGWQHDKHPFRSPIHHLRDARRAFRDQKIRRDGRDA